MKEVKRLIVSGCSFTADSNSWAHRLSYHFGATLINLAVPGAGNRHISRSIILFLEKNKIEVEGTLIIVMWSNPNRTDWLVDQFHSKHHLCSYGNQTYLAIPGDILNTCKVDTPALDAFPELLDVAYRPGKTPKIISSWESMNYLNLYLKDRNYNFIQTTFFEPSSDIPTNFKLSWGVYETLYKQVNLSLPTNNWLPLSKEEHLGNFVCDNNLLSSDNIHPSSDGHLQWTGDILIKKLTQY